MKKENRKLAQQQRAAERKKKELTRKIKKFLVIFIPLLAVLLLVAVLVWDSVRSDSSDNASASASSADSQTDTNNGGTDTSLSTDSSLSVADGNTVNIDYVGTVDGVEFDGGSTNGAGTDLTIGSGLYIDDFEEQLIGSHPGDTVEVHVTFPDPYTGNPDLSGKDAVFTVTINGIYQ